MPKSYCKWGKCPGREYAPDVESPWGYNPGENTYHHECAAGNLRSQHAPSWEQEYDRQFDMMSKHWAGVD